MGLQLVSSVILFGLKGDDNVMALIAKTADSHMVDMKGWKADELFSHDTKVKEHSLSLITGQQDKLATTD